MKTIHLDVATDIDDSTVQMFGCWKLHEASSQLGMSFGCEGWLLAAQLHFNHITDL